MRHRFFVAADQLTRDRVVFTPAQSHQIQHVLRLGRGDQVQVFDGFLPCDRLVELEDPAHGRVVAEVPHAPEPRTRLSVHPALLQREKFESVLQKLTEIGVASITPIVTARGLVRQAPDERRLARWSAIIREAAEQSGRGRVPCLAPAVPFARAVETVQGTRVVAYEAERQLTLGEALAGRPKEVSVFVGPEGGFTLEEIQCARDVGARVVTLGPRVLRTETASPLLAGLVLYELGDLSWPRDLV